MSKTIPKATIKKINKKLHESLHNYRKMIVYMCADLPIESLCLPKRYEKALIDNGLLRIYDLFNRDLREIKGIGEIGVKYLAARLDEFLAMR